MVEEREERNPFTTLVPRAMDFTLERAPETLPIRGMLGMSMEDDRDVRCCRSSASGGVVSATCWTCCASCTCESARSGLSGPRGGLGGLSSLREEETLFPVGWSLVRLASRLREVWGLTGEPLGGVWDSGGVEGREGKGEGLWLLGGELCTDRGRPASGNGSSSSGIRMCTRDEEEEGLTEDLGRDDPVIRHISLM